MQSKADPSLYVIIIDGETVYILVYVDDILMLAANMEVLQRVAKSIARILRSPQLGKGYLVSRDCHRAELRVSNREVAQLHHDRPNDWGIWRCELYTSEDSAA